MLKFLATGVLLLAATLPVKAQAGPELGVSYQIASSGPTYAKVCTRSGGGRLSLRTGPGQNFGKIKELSNGSSIILTTGRYSQDQNGYLWWNVEESNSGTDGWVRSDYVCDYN